jgi:hypothetical protein
LERDLLVASYLSGITRRGVCLASLDECPQVFETRGVFRDGGLPEGERRDGRQDSDEKRQ